MDHVVTTDAKLESAKIANLQRKIRRLVKKMGEDADRVEWVKRGFLEKEASRVELCKNYLQSISDYTKQNAQLEERIVQLGDEIKVMREESDAEMKAAVILSAENSKLTERVNCLQDAIDRRDETIAQLRATLVVSGAHSRAPVSQAPLKWSEFLARKSTDFVLTTSTGYVATANA